MSDVIKIDISDKSLSVPVDKKTLGDFISGLLGQPQTLERVIDSAFSVDHQWLVHLCSLVIQRMNQQNAPEPLAFVATIGYQNGITRKITSLLAFNHFSETQNIVSSSIKINLAVLIHFPGKLVPERQEVVLDFNADESDSNLLESLIVKKPTTAGRIRLEIRHTERTWADDVLRLITDEVDHIKVTESKLKRWMRNSAFPIFAFLFPIAMLSIAMSEMWAKGKNGAALAVTALPLIEDKRRDIAALHEKVNIVLSQIVTGDESRVGTQLIIMISGLIAMAVFVTGVLLAKPMPSFVVLSKAAETHKLQVMNRLKRKNLLLLLSMAGSVVLGVVGNFLYDKMK